MNFILKLLLNLLVCLFVNGLFAQRSYEAFSTTERIDIDGKLLESCWTKCQKADSFRVNYPNYGPLSRFQSQVFLTYGENSLFVAAILKDPRPDSVLAVFSQRDDFGNADWFGVQIDPYGNKVNAFSFYVTAAGVELDALAQGDEEDYSWNAVWKSAVQQTDEGWTLEMEIPYSAIRFPKNTTQSWAVNFKREVRRFRELSYWNPVDPAVYGEITQAGKLTGLEGIDAPIRLSFTPYGASYFEKNTVNSAQWKNSNRFGMDLKYGISDAFTLDVSLIPDFGQVIADNVILNLGPFEVQFDENRSFFKEGTELFGIGSVFYSRRIGGQPFYRNKALELGEGEKIKQMASTAPLINASKLSGRTDKGLGIGFFNAVEGRTYTEIERLDGSTRKVLSNPLTNYQVWSLSQNLKNNSTVSFLNTLVMREGDATDAHVSVLDANLFSPDGKINFGQTLKLSNRMTGNNREIGHSARFLVSKVKGVWRQTLEYYEESDLFNPNDLGFLLVNNGRGARTQVVWNDFEAGKRLLRKRITWNMQLEALYKPNLFSTFSTDVFLFGTFRNFLSAALSIQSNPFGRVDHFESRTFGIPLYFKPSIEVGGFYSSDYSKPFALDFDSYYNQFVGSNQKVWTGSLSPRMRFSDRFFVVWESGFEYFFQDYGYVAASSDLGASSNQIYIGTRNRMIFNHTLNGEFIFTKRMGITARLRYYTQTVRYDFFQELAGDGSLILSEYSGKESTGGQIHNTRFDTFSLDVNYRWVFIPGSELRIGWKNTLFRSESSAAIDAFSWYQLVGEPQTNTISVKVLVFVDALYFKAFKRKNKS